MPDAEEIRFKYAVYAATIPQPSECDSDEFEMDSPIVNDDVIADTMITVDDIIDEEKENTSIWVADPYKWEEFNTKKQTHIILNLWHVAVWPQLVDDMPAIHSTYLPFVAVQHQDRMFDDIAVNKRYYHKIMADTLEAQLFGQGFPNGEQLKIFLQNQLNLTLYLDLKVCIQTKLRTYVNVTITLTCFFF